MNKEAIIGWTLVLVLIITLVYVGVFVVFPNNAKYDQLQKECASITHPELSVDNEQKYNHCLSYPETYGVAK